jgi:hypothetical protein
MKPHCSSSPGWGAHLPRKFSDDNAEVIQNEGVFQQLLSAAFVVQQHNDQAKNSPPDPAEFRAADLSEIAETQNLIRNKHLDLISAANVIVSKAMKISAADGGAIALVSKNELSYIASDGVAARSAGTSILLDESLSAECIRTGKLQALPDLKDAPRPQAEFFRSQAVQSFASVPVRQDQTIAGVLELYFLKSNAVSEPGLRTCQLLAGLLTGTVATNSETDSDSAPAQPSPLDQLKSQLDRMVDEEDAVPDLIRPSLTQQDLSKQDAAKIAAPKPDLPPNILSSAISAPAFAEKGIVRCHKCGCPLEESESFCGLCGTSRNASLDSAKISDSAKTSHSPKTSKTPSLPDIPAPAAAVVNEPPKKVLPSEMNASLNSKADLPKRSDELPAELKEILARFPEEQETSLLAASASTPKDLLLSTSKALENVAPQAVATPAPVDSKPVQAAPEQKPVEAKGSEVKAVEVAKPDTALSVAEASANTQQWHSASETKNWLESKKTPVGAKHWLLEYRANLYLAAAILLLVLVLLGVGIPNNNGPKQLGWFDSMLVNLGLAETPSAPNFAGNPSTKVWVDTHTALYYCPGSDSYGKTQGGKFETQREAQQDQFEPASRQACP